MDWQAFEGSRGKRLWVALGFALLLLFAGPRPLLAENSLAGRLLVAAPEMADPNFAHTVIYILHHDRGGAQGLVINRPMGEAPLDRVLALLQGKKTEPPAGGGTAGDPLLVFSGGPVEPYHAFTLHSRDVMLDHSVPVDDDTAYNEGDDVLEALADHAAPKSLIFALGYSGWAPGQLETELDRGDWYVVEPDPDLVFGTEPGHMWERAAARFGTEL